MNRVKEIFEYSDMIKSLVKRDLRGKYKGSILGFLWTFINPLCQIIVYTIVFSLIARNDMQNFYVYIISGMIPWFFFDGSLRQGAGCIRGQADMVKKIYFPREVLPITTVTSNFVNMLFCFVIVLAVVAISDIGVCWQTWVFLPVIMVLEYALALGFTLIISAATVYLRDLEHIVTVLLMVWIYGTPILYSLQIIPEPIKFILKLNPMTGIIECYHAILYWQDLPSLKYMLYNAAWAVMLLVIGEFVFNKLADNFAEEL